MKKVILSGCLVVLSIILSGCIFVSSNKTQSVPNDCSSPAQTNATITEIDAAGKLVSESARANVYKAIAKRPNLTSHERIHLTNAITNNLVSESNREEVLLVLVNNVPQPQETVIVKESTTVVAKEKSCSERN